MRQGGWSRSPHRPASRASESAGGHGSWVGCWGCPVRASDYLGLTVTVERCRAEWHDELAPSCGLCGERLRSRIWDPAGFRGVEVGCVEMEVTSGEPGEDTITETVHVHDDCADDFEEEIQKGRGA